MKYKHGKRCVFSTGNESYIAYAIVSLLSFRSFNPDYDMFVLCSSMSEDNKLLCASCGVTPIELDLTNVFFQEWMYPKECFYHFKGPELFDELGYEHSVYVDGDTYCNGEFEIDSPESFHIAGTSYDTTGELFSSIGDADRVKDCFGVSDHDGYMRRRIQSGVLVYDNALLSAFGYFEKAGNIFKRSVQSGVPRKGDDSLLALMVAIHPELSTLCLPHKYNYISYLADPNHDLREEAKCVIYHFVERKPWHKSENASSVFEQDFRTRWLKILADRFPSKRTEDSSE